MPLGGEGGKEMSQEALGVGGCIMKVEKCSFKPNRLSAKSVKAL